MKCIYCQTDSKKRERDEGKCPKCHARFAFDPSTGDPFSDLAFKNMIDRVSANGTVRWGRDHLYYELCRGAIRKRRASAIGGYFFAAFGGVFASAVMHSLAGLGLGVLIGAVNWSRARSPFVPLPTATFDTLFTRWQHAHPGKYGLIERPPEQRLPPQLSEEDMLHYSFDRAVICDRSSTVDLLLANNFHFENNCAVLGVKGYPKATFGLVRKMLRRNPRLQVFVLHDATEEGCNLARRLAADPTWFHRIGRVIDVGIRPHHAAAFKGAFRAPQGPVRSKLGLLPGEEQWLSKYNLELAAIRPEQVIKRLFKAMTAHPLQPGGSVRFNVTTDDHNHEQVDQDVDASASWSDGADASGSWDDGVTASDSWSADMDSFGGDASDSDGGGDSFG
jgi:hypothetical protein